MFVLSLVVCHCLFVCFVIRCSLTKRQRPSKQANEQTTVSTTHRPPQLRQRTADTDCSRFVCIVHGFVFGFSHHNSKNIKPTKQQKTAESPPIQQPIINNETTNNISTAYTANQPIKTKQQIA